MPAIVDLAAMRDAMDELGSDPSRINPLVPVDLVIDHSVQVDAFGNARAFDINADRDYERNRERYAFLRWGQQAFDNFRVVPPATGICHQVNLEYLGQVVFRRERDGVTQAYPDTLVGTDSHTTMVNGLGVLGWGVGGIEAEAAMLGQPISMLLPQVVGFRLDGELPEGATATDLVLTVTEMLRERGVVSKFVEFFGPGLHTLGLADRATIGNMSPEFGSTCAIFPVDRETLRYLEFTGRPTETIELVDAYAREQGMFHDEELRGPDVHRDRSSWTSAASSRRSPGRSAPRTGSPLADAKPAFIESLAEFDPDAAAALGNGRDEAIEETLPGLRPAGRGPRRRRGPPARLRARRRGRQPGDDREARGRPGHGQARRRGGGRARPRPGGDRGDHELHEHLEPVGDDRRRAAGPQGGRAGAAAQAVGEDLARPRLDRGHRVPRARGPRRGPRQARLQPRRLRVHDLHRQLGAAAGGDLRGGERERPGRLRGALGQPQLRGPDQPGRAQQLPGLAAALRRLRARRPHGHRPAQRPARRGRGRQPGPPRRHLADARRRSSGRSTTRCARRCSSAATPTCSPATTAGASSRRPRATATRGPTRPTCASRRSSRAWTPSRRRSSRSRAPGCSPCSATASRPTTSRRPARSRGTAPPAGG